MNRKQLLVLWFFLTALIFFNLTPAQQDTASNKEQIVNSKTHQPNKYELREEEQAMNSDLVVIGIIREMRDTPAKTNEMFHSMIIVKIDSVLKGFTNHRNIIIRLKSGPVTDDIHGGDRIISSIEPIFNIGEKVFLFLNINKNDPYLNSDFVKNNYKSFDSKKNISELSEDTFWISNKQVFKSENGIVKYFGRKIKETEFINYIIK